MTVPRPAPSPGRALDLRFLSGPSARPQRDLSQPIHTAFQVTRYNPGVWVFHCHELHHTENDGVEPGGLIQVIQYEGVAGPTLVPAAPQPQPTPMPPDMPGMVH